MEMPGSLAPGPTKSRLPVVGLGLATSALALFGVWIINQATEDFNLMGLYYFYIIPAGAILVGIIAGSGYGLGSWWSGVRISRGLLWLVVLLQLTVYFAAQYLEYLYVVEEYGLEASFFEFFDFSTRQFSFKERHGDGAGDPLGGWGYAVRVLEIGGFVLGGLVAPLVLRATSYCEQCQIYMRSRQVVLLPAGAEVKKIKRKDAQAKASYEQEHEQAWQSGLQALEALRQHAEAGRSAEFFAIVDRYAPEQKQIGKRSSRIAVKLDACPSCSQGLLRAVQITGQGNNISKQNLGVSPVHTGLVRDLASRS